MYFHAKPNHQFIRQIYFSKKNSVEEDHSLYFDTFKKEYFVIESTEHISGPNVTSTYIIRPYLKKNKDSNV